MDGKRWIETISIRNLLSFGGEARPIELQPLNVLIGPNGSGKSNLIEVLSLLKAAPTDLVEPIRTGGGINEWLWKWGGKAPTAEIDLTFAAPDGNNAMRYRLEMRASGQRVELSDESIEYAVPSKGYKEPFFFYRYQSGDPVLNIRNIPDATIGGTQNRSERTLRRDALLPDQSVLAQCKEPDLYPELAYLSKLFSGVQLYREWNFGRFTAPRLVQQADLPTDFLSEDASNLGLVLNDLTHSGNTKQRIIEHLRLFSDDIRDYSVKVQSNSVQLFLQEQNLAGKRQSIPATRLSDGTLRYLCLLAVLLHPEPPPIIAIEEPELGLHPDIIPTLAELLVDATQRTQLIVTTHSDALIAALSETPESVIVCERDLDGTQMRRLDRTNLASWLENYSLGALWKMGELGGNRW